MVDRRTQVAPCAFCGRDTTQVERLIAGPNGVAICDGCSRLGASLVGHGGPASDAHVTLAVQQGSGDCGFCGRDVDGPDLVNDGPALVVASGAPRGAICAECLALAVEILDDQTTRD